MLSLGRLCVKTCGRDAMQFCVIVEEIDEKYVLIDGNTRRKKVNKAHIEPLNKVFDIKKGSDTKTILELFEKEEIQVKKAPEAKIRKEAKPQIKKVHTKKQVDKTKKVSKKENK